MRHGEAFGSHLKHPYIDPCLRLATIDIFFWRSTKTTSEIVHSAEWRLAALFTHISKQPLASRYRVLYNTAVLGLNLR